MNTFRVWLRPLGNACRVLVDGIENANWLLDRLHQSCDIRTSEPCSKNERGSGCSFEVLYSQRFSRFRLDTLLAAIPEVHLMTAPDQTSAAKKGTI